VKCCECMGWGKGKTVVEVVVLVVSTSVGFCVNGLGANDSVRGQ